eukprot:789617-Amphidinium_carterae.1
MKAKCPTLTSLAVLFYKWRCSPVRTDFHVAAGWLGLGQLLRSLRSGLVDRHCSSRTCQKDNAQEGENPGMTKHWNEHLFTFGPFPLCFLLFWAGGGDDYSFLTIPGFCFLKSHQND